MKRPTKYHSCKVHSTEGTFDSRFEYERWCQLKLLQRAGRIKDLDRQVPFELIPAQYESYPGVSPKTGKRLTDGKRCVEKSVTYNADFVYLDLATGEKVVEDTKSSATRTKDYVIKRKLMLYVHGIRIREMMR